MAKRKSTQTLQSQTFWPNSPQLAAAGADVNFPGGCPDTVRTQVSTNWNLLSSFFCSVDDALTNFCRKWGGYLLLSSPWVLLCCTLWLTVLPYFHLGWREVIQQPCHGTAKCCAWPNVLPLSSTPAPAGALKIRCYISMPISIVVTWPTTTRTVSSSRSEFLE